MKDGKKGMLTGNCLCGAVSFLVQGELEHQPEACHCTMCRKQSGTFLTAVNVRKSRLELKGEKHVKWYASSDNVSRGFCADCGSTLFWRPNMDGYEWIAISMGLFDSPTGARLSKHTFVSEKGDYYDISDDVPATDGF